MENASKALLMAGEILISIIIVSALLLMFNSLTSYQGVKEQSTKEAQVIAFNSIYEAYNTNNVRGNDLYSLLNRVVDYNKRKSTEGTGERDEGQYIAYQPITIKVSLKTADGENQKKLRYDETQRVFTGNPEFIINSTNNTFDNLFEEIVQLEEKYPPGALMNLTTAIAKIFVTSQEFNNFSQSEKAQIIYNFNSAYGSQKLSANSNSHIINSWGKINSEYREDIYKYYEYLQFTRAHFNCTSVGYNEGTGRIVSMEFQFTGEIN